MINWFFSSQLSKREHKKLDSELAINVPKRKITSVLKMPDVWLIVVRDRTSNKKQIVATKNPYQFMRIVFQFEIADGMYENVEGAMSPESLYEDYNNIIVDLMQKSNVIVKQFKPDLNESMMVIFESPNHRLNSREELDEYLQIAFKEFDAKVYLIDKQGE